MSTPAPDVPENPLRALHPPAVPPGLRQSTLRAAGAALLEPSASWVDRLWESRALRGAWLGAVVCLIALHVVAAGSSERGFTHLPAKASAAASRLDGAGPGTRIGLFLARQSSLPGDRLESLGRGPEPWGP